jgi:hypothetical protein
MSPAEFRKRHMKIGHGGGIQFGVSGTGKALAQTGDTQPAEDKAGFLTLYLALHNGMPLAVTGRRPYPREDESGAGRGPGGGDD